MRINAMTATFGKLDGETLRLEPGLNIITAPNEWGKSTWCAFLLAMLYGVDTKQRAKQGTLPDKERYKPWNGKPMEGAVELEWNGRRITIQRRTKGRIPMGEFRAFETDTGLTVPELTAANCGQTLLGVERGVYQRSGFLRGGDLPVSQDEALSRRLNQLVTTGDDSPAAPGLEAKLRDLRNKCQYNKTGLLPQARGQLLTCQKRLEQRQALERRGEALRREVEDLERRTAELNRHGEALKYRENQARLTRLEEARAREAQAKAAEAEAQARCQSLPDQLETQRRLQEYDRIQSEVRALDLEAAMEHPAPEAPAAPLPFRGLDGDAARRQVQRELDELSAKEAAAQHAPAGKRSFILAGILAAVGILLAIVLPGWTKLAGLAALPAAAGLALLGRSRNAARRAALDDALACQETLLNRYGVAAPEEIPAVAEDYAAALEEYEASNRKRLDDARALATRRNQLTRRQSDLAPSRESLEDILAAWSSWDDARRAAQTARGHREALEAMAAGLDCGPAPGADGLTLSPEETRLALRQTGEKLTFTRSELDRCLGQTASLEDRESLEAEAEQLQGRIARLEQFIAALDAALDCLSRAQRELQSRFAPKITAAAQSILSGLTDGRYNRLLMDEAMNLSATAEDESAVVPLAWRSDGTGDQIYLALRLAVSRALIPDAPLILDDALTRFDDARLSAALALLKAESQTRQILLFTCQSREENRA